MILKLNKQKTQFKTQSIIQSKINIGITYKLGYLSFLPKKINDKIIVTTMMTRAASARAIKTILLQFIFHAHTTV